MERAEKSAPGGAPLLLSADEVERALTPDLAFDSQVEAFRALAAGEAVAPDKLTVPWGQDTAWALCYAARTSPTGGVVTKLVSVAERNPERGLPMINAVVAESDPHSGRLPAIMEGTPITTLRTTVASAVAAKALAVEDADTLAVIGSGVQAVAHIHALLRVQPIRTVHIWSPNREHRERVAAALDGEIAPRVLAAASAEGAVQRARELGLGRSLLL
jgi:ornithine cyclodeaminase/alanine dehydrogenase-like protein (mu-crystallin family)